MKAWQSNGYILIVQVSETSGVRDIGNSVNVPRDPGYNAIQFLKQFIPYFLLCLFALLASHKPRQCPTKYIVRWFQIRVSRSPTHRFGSRSDISHGLPCLA